LNTPPASLDQNAPRRVHYVLSTHWDREWYQSFQHYRYRLVQMLDRVLDGLADGRLKGPFTTDGQSIVLEDYLEVRPERRGQIEAYAKDGKLVIGPWYVMPDEFLVSGESLIRNIRLGRQIARSFGGEPSNAGFVCDLFGHNSQMPQILTGFGIRAGLVWRGLNNIDSRLIKWLGTDGTEMPCYRFGKHGYCGYSNEVRFAGEPLQDNLTDGDFDPVRTVEAIEAYCKQEAGLTPHGAPLLMFDGGDHQYWDEATYRVLSDRFGKSDGPFEIIHSTLDAYLDEMAKHAHQIDMIVEGELREPGRHRSSEDNQWLIAGTGSSRMWIKQANAACQTLLCQWAEPMSTLAHNTLGDEYPQSFLDIAWKWLIKNHPHDSICGCSIDQVHEDMKFRFSQCSQIAERLTLESTRAIAAHIEGGVSAGEIRVTVFNPLPVAFDQTAEITIELPNTCPIYPAYGGTAQELIYHVYDSEDNELPTQTLAQTFNRTKILIADSKFPKSYKAHDARISLPLRIPALGYTTLTVHPGIVDDLKRLPLQSTLVTSERSMSNEHLDVTIETNGSLTIHDKRTGRTYERLLTFEDAVDCGDGWSRGTAVGDRVYTSTASASSIALITDGPMISRFRIRTTMRVPSGFDYSDGGQRRRDDLVELDIDSIVSLRPGTDRVEIESTINNQSSDHRLRVLFPSGVETQTYLADSPFDVVERSIALRKDNHLYREPEIETKPQQHWTAVFDQQRGLAVIGDGLLESAVRDQADHPIALTLFRSTGHTVYTNGEPGGQLIGPMTFKYWIVPLEGEPDRAAISRMGQLLSSGIREVNLTRQRLDLNRTSAATLPPAGGLLALDGNAVLTSTRQIDRAIEARMFNPSDKTCKITLRPSKHLNIKQAQPVNNESYPIGDVIAIEDGVFRLTLKRKQILTLSLHVEE
jgi:alpha-mannosidase